MGKFGQVLKKMRLSTLQYFMIFGRKAYNKHLVRIYKKYGVVFSGGVNYISYRAHLDTSAPIYIGRNVVIAQYTIILTHDAALSYKLHNLKTGQTEVKIAPTKIGDNTFIGQRVTILCGISIGSNCIVGAGSVVTKDIPDGMVYAGNPAHQICSIEEYSSK